MARGARGGGERRSGPCGGLRRTACLEELVEAAGFRLRRSSGVYRVRIDDGDDARARRASLRDAGLAVEDLDGRLNGGEALTFELPTFEAPLPLTAAVWRDVVLRSRDGDGELLGLRILADRRASTPSPTPSGAPACCRSSRGLSPSSIGCATPVR